MGRSLQSQGYTDAKQPGVIQPKPNKGQLSQTVK